MQAAGTRDGKRELSPGRACLKAAVRELWLPICTQTASCPQPGLVGRAGYLESDQHSHFLALCHLNKLLHLFEPPTHSSTIIPTSTGGCEG